MFIRYGDQVVTEVLAAIPEFRPHYNEHLRDYEELLLHVLMADLARFTVSAECAGDAAMVDRVLVVADRLLVDGDDMTRELVAVSFVEHLGAETEPGERDVVERLPPALAAELLRQREWRPPN